VSSQPSPTCPATHAPRLAFADRGALIGAARGGRKKGAFAATTKVYPHQFVGVSSGRGKLDLRHNDLLAENSKLWLASANVSRFQLERQVLAEHVGAPTRDPNPRINRLWSRFHKDFRQDWDQNGARTDRVPVALALGFCVEAVRAEEHDPNVLPVAVSLLALSRVDGLADTARPGPSWRSAPRSTCSPSRASSRRSRG
jgi:hypothetical protein